MAPLDYDLVTGTYLSEDWTGTALDILDVTECPLLDRLFILECLDVPASIWRSFGRWCALQPTHKNPGAGAPGAIEAAAHSVYAAEMLAARTAEIAMDAISAAVPVDAASWEALRWAAHDAVQCAQRAVVEDAQEAELRRLLKQHK